MWGARIRTLIARAWITLALVESAWLAYPLVRARVLALEDTPAARGRRVAAGLGCFGAAQLEDLVAYLRAASGQVLPEEPLAARGADLATELGCFACHGPLGAGGMANPGSLKGYVPGFWGADFDDLVRSDEELWHWIAEGEIRRITEHPISAFFFRRQAIKMAAFGRFLPEADVRALAAYVRWIHAGACRPPAR